MAQEQQFEIQNKRMLVVAAVLALVVVVLWNLHIRQIRKENEEDLVAVFELTESLKPGDTILPEHVRSTPIARRFLPVSEQDVNDVVMASQIGIVGYKMKEGVAAGRILKWSYVEGGQSVTQERVAPPEGYRLVSVSIDSDTTPPAEGDYVDLWVTPPGRESICAMERVLVKSIAGSGRRVDAVGIEVEERDLPGLLQLMDAKIRFRLFVRPPGEKVKMAGFNKEALAGLVIGSSQPRSPTVDDH